MPRRPGEVVALREIWQGRVWEARPAVVVEDAPDRRSFFIPAGTVAQLPADERGELLRLPAVSAGVVLLVTMGVGVIGGAASL